MKTEIKVPAMGESITEATIGEIFIPTGTKVKEDGEILELETEKVNQVIYAPEAGIINLDVKEGDVVKIGQQLGYVDSKGTATAKPPKQKETEIREKTKIEPKAGGARYDKEAFVADLKKKEAPTVKKEQQQAPTMATIKGERKETRSKMSNVRKAIAKRLVEAKQSTAMLTTFNEVDMSDIIKLRAECKDSFEKEHGVRLGFMSFFVKAIVSALQTFPGLNSYIDGEEMVHREYYDVGIAVGTDKGLFVPVLRNCDRLSYADIERAIGDYARKARDGKITMDDLQGGSFTITNGGIYGSLLSTPILTPPQSGILGMHKIEKRPVVVDDQVVVRPMMYLALSYDHRIVDGKDAVSFLVHIKDVLEMPARAILS